MLAVTYAWKEMCVVVATVTSKGQVTIPKDIRDRLGIRPGDHIEFVESGEGYVVQKRLETSPFDKWIGYLQHLGEHDSDALVEEMRGR